MKNYIQIDPWKIIEEGFHPANNKISESLFSLGNGKFGLRGNFAEKYTGHTLQGSYLAGIYYPDKTKVGWWKNGYPEYFAKVLNSCNWIGLKITINGIELDLNKCSIDKFHRYLDMKEGVLYRTCSLTTENDIKLSIKTERFCSMADEHTAALQYEIKILQGKGELSIDSYLDSDVENEDSNYDEKFWDEINLTDFPQGIYNEARTKKTEFHAGHACITSVLLNDVVMKSTGTVIKEKLISENFKVDFKDGSVLKLTKHLGIHTSFDTDLPIEEKVLESCLRIYNKTFAKAKEEHIKEWANKWNDCDIEIIGDDGAQQGIRFNIFHLHQTYTGKDSRLNIGPKGFTGEKYGGSTYWDTEAYCIPFYLSTSDSTVSRNLLIYRHNQLGKAIENAEKLGFENGAALYPMVTINGEECHNEWEITFEEIHRNGAIVYAIFDYIQYTGDHSYMADYGIDVLIAIARFWSQRFNYSEARKMYVMLGVTGPNEYENNVNNNWYTNYIARWCLRYCMESIESLSKIKKVIFKRNNFKEDELNLWRKIIDHVYLPESKELGIFLQQDNFLDKEQILVKDLDPKHLPLNQKWSWDRILRSVFIKQADVLQGIYFFENHFDKEVIERNFDFYEPRTVHESSLSPCVHVILASLLGRKEKAYEMYLRTSRLDIDDYNNDTEDGLHITSMAGTWMSVVRGFGGMRIKNDRLYFDPLLPDHWEEIRFRIKFRNQLLHVKINQYQIYLFNESPEPMEVSLRDQNVKLLENENTTIHL